jgi:hypothetical protein
VVIAISVIIVTIHGLVTVTIHHSGFLSGAVAGKVGCGWFGWQAGQETSVW